MPELPEVETTRRGLEKIMAGKVFKKVEVRRPDLRGPIPPALKKTLEGRRLSALERRGKYMLFRLETGAGFALHLGMSGRMVIAPAGRTYSPAKHDHIIFTMEDGARIAFNDARRFGTVFLLAPGALSLTPPFDSMGPEPLARGFSGKQLLQAFMRRKGPVKPALLDQSVVSGIGNIYACEALYHAGIDPRAPAQSLTAPQTDRLAKAIKHVLDKAIKAGGSSLKDFRHADGKLGYFQHLFSVYDRTGRACPDCHCDPDKTGGILKITQGGRSTFYCPRIQK